MDSQSVPDLEDEVLELLVGWSSDTTDSTHPEGRDSTTGVSQFNSEQLFVACDHAGGRQPVRKGGRAPRSRGIGSYPYGHSMRYPYSDSTPAPKWTSYAAELKATSPNTYWKMKATMAKLHASKIPEALSRRSITANAE